MSARRTEPQPDRRYEQAVDDYLRDCYARRTTVRVSELAQLLGVSRPYLSRVMARRFGRPLSTVLREKQVNEAKRLLQTTDRSMDDVAAACGFGDRSTFYRVFRAMTGSTPRQYRNR